MSTVGEGVHGRGCVCVRGRGGMHGRGHVRTNKAQFYYQALNMLVKKLIFYHHQGLQYPELM